MSEAEAPIYFPAYGGEPRFFDTSALVKRYHREKGTDLVDAAFERTNTRWISSLGVIPQERLAAMDGGAPAAPGGDAGWDK